MMHPLALELASRMKQLEAAFTAPVLRRLSKVVLHIRSGTNGKKINDMTLEFGVGEDKHVMEVHWMERGE